MRGRFLFAFLLLVQARAASLTVLLEFDGPQSESSVRAMKREVQSIFRHSGIQFDWKRREQVRTGDSFPDFLMIRFQGNCRIGLSPPLLDERGPLAETYVTDGHILPFSEVKCDRVLRSIRNAVAGSSSRRADSLLGRALGRVAAHEIYHILSGTARHARTGVARPSLSPAQLTSDRLALNPEDLERFHLP
jgi:hypothetical protein